MLQQQLKLSKVKGRVDVGLDDPLIVDVSLEVTPRYAAWLRKRHKKDVRIMQPESGAWSSSGSGKHAVDNYVGYAITLVESLIEAGVPEKVAHQLLPHELYCQLHKEK